MGWKDSSRHPLVQGYREVTQYKNHGDEQHNPKPRRNAGHIDFPVDTV